MTLDGRPLRVLMIDDDEEEFVLAKAHLEQPDSAVDLEWAESLTAGMETLSQKKFDVVLLDLFMSDSRGLETFTKLRAKFPNVPIVIMSGLDDEKLALEAVRGGAQDYLVKGHGDRSRLFRVLNYAINRHERQKDSADEALIDSLTKLYNRRGFLAMAEQHMKIARRDQKTFFVFFAVLNGFEQIVEEYGEDEGQHALLTTADILGESFRTGDILARIGQNEFAIITTVEGHFDPKLISARIAKSQKFYESQFNSVRFSLSLCSSYIDLSQDEPMSEFEAHVDRIFQEYHRRQPAVS